MVYITCPFLLVVRLEEGVDAPTFSAVLVERSASGEEFSRLTNSFKEAQRWCRSSTPIMDREVWGAVRLVPRPKLKGNRYAHREF